MLPSLSVTSASAMRQTGSVSGKRDGASASDMRSEPASVLVPDFEASASVLESPSMVRASVSVPSVKAAPGTVSGAAPADAPVAVTAAEPGGVCAAVTAAASVAASAPVAAFVKILAGQKTVPVFASYVGSYSVQQSDVAWQTVP